MLAVALGTYLGLTAAEWLSTGRLPAFRRAAVTCTQWRPAGVAALVCTGWSDE